jgi:hypothetical protein
LGEGNGWCETEQNKRRDEATHVGPPEIGVKELTPLRKKRASEFAIYLPS